MASLAKQATVEDDLEHESGTAKAQRRRVARRKRLIISHGGDNVISITASLVNGDEPVKPAQRPVKSCDVETKGQEAIDQLPTAEGKEPGPTSESKAECPIKEEGKASDNSNAPAPTPAEEKTPIPSQESMDEAKDGKGDENDPAIATVPKQAAGSRPKVANKRKGKPNKARPSRQAKDTVASGGGTSNHAGVSAPVDEMGTESAARAKEVPKDGDKQDAEQKAEDALEETKEEPGKGTDQVQAVEVTASADTEDENIDGGGNKGDPTTEVEPTADIVADDPSKDKADQTEELPTEEAQATPESVPTENDQSAAEVAAEVPCAGQKDKQIAAAASVDRPDSAVEAKVEATPPQDSPPASAEAAPAAGTSVVEPARAAEAKADAPEQAASEAIEAEPTDAGAADAAAGKDLSDPDGSKEGKESSVKDVTRTEAIPTAEIATETAATDAPPADAIDPPRADDNAAPADSSAAVEPDEPAPAADRAVEGADAAVAVVDGTGLKEGEARLQDGEGSPRPARRHRHRRRRTSSSYSAADGEAKHTRRGESDANTRGKANRDQARARKRRQPDERRATRNETNEADDKMKRRRASETAVPVMQAKGDSAETQARRRRRHSQQSGTQRAMDPATPDGGAAAASPDIMAATWSSSRSRAAGRHARGGNPGAHKTRLAMLGEDREVEGKSLPSASRRLRGHDRSAADGKPTAASLLKKIALSGWKRLLSR